MQPGFDDRFASAYQHAMVEVAQRGRMNVTVSALVVRHGATTADVQVSGLSRESTLVLEVLK